MSVVIIYRLDILLGNEISMITYNYVIVLISFPNILIY